MTSQLRLGRLKKVNLRECWESESADFTPWLAQESNIKLLSDTIGLELEVEAQEKDVGPFRADILCRDTSKDEEAESWVLIENQLERTDHIHLGQLLTYAAGLNAVTIIWISARFTDEHRATLDWLNKITSENFTFFGLEIELWRIGESAIAPKFNIVSKPNDWSKTVSGVAKTLQNSNHTEKKKLQYEYWKVFNEYAQEHADLIKPTKPLYQHWMNIAIGRSGFLLQAIASYYNSETESYAQHENRAELCISGKDAKTYFKALKQQQAEIEAELGTTLVWYNPADAKQCRIYVRRSVNLEQREDWDSQHHWLLENLDRLHATFARRIKQLDLSDLPDSNLADVSDEQDSLSIMEENPVISQIA